MEDIRNRAAALDRRLRIRNGIEYIAAGMVGLLFASVAWQGGHWLWTASCLGLVAASVWIAGVLWWRGRSLAMADLEAPTSTYLALHRESLRRQIRLLRSAWAWYVLPLAVGITGLMVSMVLIHPGLVESLVFWAIVAGELAFSVFVAALNRIAARKLRAELDALP